MHGKNEVYNIFHHSIALITHKFKVYLIGIMKFL